MSKDTSIVKEDTTANEAAANTASTNVAPGPGLMDETDPTVAVSVSKPASDNTDTTIVDDNEPRGKAETVAPETPTVETHTAAPDVTFDDGALSQATGVNDNMSFSQAFAAARAEVGAGGTFEWHGQVYGTYYKNEWDNMSAQERHDFQVAAIRGNHAPSDTAHTEHYTTPATPENSSQKYSYEEPDDTQHDPQQPIEVDTVDDDEVRILGLETVDNGEGGQINIAALDVSGQHAMLIDIDNDRVMDVLVHDDNNDGEYSEDEIEDVSSYNITVSDIQAQMQQSTGTVPAQEYTSNEVAQNQDFSNNDFDMSDFDNNADVSDFV